MTNHTTQNRLRWGIIGTGYAAEQVTSALHSLPEAAIQAVASRSLNRAIEFARRHSIPVQFGDYEDLIESDQVDIVYIAASAPMHHSLCMKSIACRKPVICEKPLCMSLTEATEIVNASEVSSCFVMEAMWSRFIPLMKLVRRVVERGEIGDVKSVIADFGLRNTPQSNPRLFDLEEGGALRDLGVYPLSFAVSFLGSVEDANFNFDLGASGVDERAAGVVRFATGGLACIQADIRCQTPTKASIIGTEGFIDIDAPMYRPTSATVTKVVEPKPIARSINHQTASASLITSKLKRLASAAKKRWFAGTRLRQRCDGNGYQYQAMEVMRCVKAGLIESPIMPLSESLEVMKAVDLGYRSKESCQPRNETRIGV